ncbi:MAG: ethylbenzene dehydrogenase-related protein [Rhodocyclaceae bacterium]|nr:ethylbenzene dehydrogenase-related protein [Rhodocyclaceae bacterium]
MYKKLAISMLTGTAATMAASPVLAAEPDWSKVPTSTLTLFYPGISSYQWLRTPDHKRAQKETQEGQACTNCHKNDEKTIGNKLVKEGPLEPTPVSGKNGYVDVKLQVAYDDKNAYFRYQWKTQGDANIEYPYYRFDGKEWKRYGGPRLDQAVQDGKQPPLYEARMSIMIDDGKVPMFKEQGCWLTCHEGMRDVNPATKEEVAANAAMKAYKREDVRKYLPASRTDVSDWKTGKSLEEIAKIKAAGGFVDLIQWRAHRSNPMGYADDGYVLEWRNFDAGKKMFDANLDKATKQPKFMFDAGKFGAKAVTAAQVGKKDNFLIKGVNAVPFNPGAGWKEGDLLPLYVLTKEVEGSVVDNKASGAWKDGLWTVVMTRPLGLANDDDKTLKEGGVYSVGFAVHDDQITTRGHHVSFPKTLGFGAKADIQAVKVK